MEQGDCACHGDKRSSSEPEVCGLLERTLPHNGRQQQHAALDRSPSGGGGTALGGLAGELAGAGGGGGSEQHLSGDNVHERAAAYGAAAPGGTLAELRKEGSDGLGPGALAGALAGTDWRRGGPTHRDSSDSLVFEMAPPSPGARGGRPLLHVGGAVAGLGGRSVSFLTAVLMGVALCFHSLLEGAAMGAQPTIRCGRGVGEWVGENWRAGCCHRC